MFELYPVAIFNLTLEPDELVVLTDLFFLAYNSNNNTQLVSESLTGQKVQIEVDRIVQSERYLLKSKNWNFTIWYEALWEAVDNYKKWIFR